MLRVDVKFQKEGILSNSDAHSDSSCVEIQELQLQQLPDEYHIKFLSFNFVSQNNAEKSFKLKFAD